MVMEYWRWKKCGMMLMLSVRPADVRSHLKETGFGWEDGDERRQQFRVFEKGQ